VIAEGKIASGEFVDDKGARLRDYVAGWPTVLVGLEVGFTPSANPTVQFTPNFKIYRALLDTGASATILDESLAPRGLKPLRQAPGLNMGTVRFGNVHRALLEVKGLNRCSCAS
jgi:hypothetical protein